MPAPAALLRTYAAKTKLFFPRPPPTYFCPAIHIQLDTARGMDKESMGAPEKKTVAPRPPDTATAHVPLLSQALSFCEVDRAHSGVAASSADCIRAMHVAHDAELVRRRVVDWPCIRWRGCTDARGPALFVGPLRYAVPRLLWELGSGRPADAASNMVRYVVVCGHDDCVNPLHRVRVTRAVAAKMKRCAEEMRRIYRQFRAVVQPSSVNGACGNTAQEARRLTVDAALDAYVQTLPGAKQARAVL